MLLPSRILISVLFAATLSSVSSAETPDSITSIEPGEITLSAQLDLDEQFERSLAHAADSRLQRMAGPSSMICSPAIGGDEFDTCVVTALGTPLAAGPAAIAPN